MEDANYLTKGLEVLMDFTNICPEQMMFIGRISAMSNYEGVNTVDVSEDNPESNTPTDYIITLNRGYSIEDHAEKALKSVGLLDDKFDPNTRGIGQYDFKLDGGAGHWQDYFCVEFVEE